MTTSLLNPINYNMEDQIYSAEQLSEINQELLTGKGYIIIPQLFSAEEIREAREIILFHSNQTDSTVTHFQGKNDDKIKLQRRVWNLLNKGDIFVKMVQHPLLMQIGGAFLGDEFCLGSIAANRILPGGPGQEAHVDYPYWDLYKRSSFPTNLNPSFPLNMQITIMLDDFTEESGATAVLPNSQLKCEYPTEETFNKGAERMIGKAGDVAAFFGLTWHCASDNKSQNERSAILIQYLPKFIKPMEDQKRGVKSEVQDEASKELKQLLGYNYPYPLLFDQEAGGNAEGKNSKRQHKISTNK